VQKTAAQHGAIVVLKGAHSLIGLPDQRVFVNTTGNHAMATAGSGDVLTGAIAAMAGAGLPLDMAVCRGVDLHGRAGDIAARKIGADGVTASDILEALPEAVRQTRIAKNNVQTLSGILTIV
jgi:NAD(P)H-hydrate epimerase